MLAVPPELCKCTTLNFFNAEYTAIPFRRNQESSNRSSQCINKLTAEDPFSLKDLEEVSFLNVFVIFTTVLFYYT